MLFKPSTATDGDHGTNRTTKAILLSILIASVILLIQAQTARAAETPAPFSFDVTPKRARVQAGDTITYNVTVRAKQGFDGPIRFQFEISSIVFNTRIDLGSMGPPYPRTFIYNVTVPRNTDLSITVNGTLRGTSGNATVEKTVELTVTRPSSSDDVMSLLRGLLQTMRDFLRNATAPTTTWAPSVGGALVATAASVGATSIVTLAGSAVFEPASFPFDKLAKKISDMLPSIFKKWLNLFIKSKFKFSVEGKRGSLFILTREEAASFMLSVSILTLSFSYAKAPTLQQIIYYIPLVLVTTILVELVTEVILKGVSRSHGVWCEYRLWYFGLTSFILTTLAFKAPFSSPKTICYYSSKFTKRSRGLVSTTAVIVPLALSLPFYLILVSGQTLIGNTGLIVCLTAALFDSVPIPKLHGKFIYDWNKIVWATLFEIASVLYVLTIIAL